VTATVKAESAADKKSAYEQLNKRYRAFVDAYLATGPHRFNQTQAAVAAGYAEKSARQQASRLMTNANIQAAIDERLTELMMSANEVMVRLTDQAQFNLGNYLMYPSLAVDIRAMVKDGYGHLIKSIKPRQFGDEVEFHDPFAALQLIGKHHKLFVERHEVAGPGGVPLGLSGDVAKQAQAELERWRTEQQCLLEQLLTMPSA